MNAKTPSTATHTAPEATFSSAIITGCGAATPELTKQLAKYAAYINNSPAHAEEKDAALSLLAAKHFMSAKEINASTTTPVVVGDDKNNGHGLPGSKPIGWSIGSGRIG